MSLLQRDRFIRLYINRQKVEKHAIISIEGEKTLDRMQHSFTVKTLSNVAVEMEVYNLIKRSMKPIVYIIINGKMLNFSSLR